MKDYRRFCRRSLRKYGFARDSAYKELLLIQKSQWPRQYQNTKQTNKSWKNRNESLPEGKHSLYFPSWLEVGGRGVGMGDGGWRGYWFFQNQQKGTRGGGCNILILRWGTNSKRVRVFKEGLVFSGEGRVELLLEWGRFQVWGFQTKSESLICKESFFSRFIFFSLIAKITGPLI